MVPRSNLQLLSVDGGAPGSAGFKLTGASREGAGLCRVWLRRGGPWTRYLDPRFRSDDWDVRCYRRVDSAFALVEDFVVETLDGLADEFAFEAGAEIETLKPNGDTVHDTVLGWAKRTLGAKADAPGAVSVPAAPIAEPKTKSVLPLRVPAPAPVAAPAPSKASAPEPAAPAPEPVPAPAPATAIPVPAHSVEPTPIEPPPIAAPDTSLPGAFEVSDAWDEIADLAGRATVDSPDAVKE